MPECYTVQPISWNYFTYSLLHFFLFGIVSQPPTIQALGQNPDVDDEAKKEDKSWKKRAYGS